VVQKKAYEKIPKFTVVTTDEFGNIIVGDEHGGIRIFTEVGKRAVKAINGFGSPATNVSVSTVGDILVTTDEYFILYTNLSNNEPSDQYSNRRLGFLDRQVIEYLNLHGMYITNAQFNIIDGKQTICFSMGKYIFHWRLEDFLRDIKEYKVYEANSLIRVYKFKDDRINWSIKQTEQFILTDICPARIAL
jgi:hypothetical protein